VWRWLLAIWLILLIGSAYQIARQVLAVGVTFTPRAERWLLVIALGVVAFLDLIALIATWTAWGKSMVKRWNGRFQASSPPRWLAGVVAVVAMSAYTFLVLKVLGDLLIDIFPRLLLFSVVVTVVGLSLKKLKPSLSARLAGTAASLSTAFVYQTALFLNAVRDFPFSIGWSETSRYYYASLFFDRKLYGLDLSPSVLHPTRYLMQSLPFLFEGIPLWGHRLWQALLWIVFTALAAYFLVRRLRLRGWLPHVLTAMTVYLYLFRGAVYYHLLVPVIIVLAGFDRRKLWRSTIVVALASAWAGISRINWYPVPAMLAIALYLLEARQGEEPLWRYLSFPALWSVLGVGTAFGSQALYMFLSGNQPEQFTSSFSSNLLWYRLWPSATFRLGLVFSALLVSFPLLWLIIARLWRGRGRWSFIRVFGLVAMLVVLFAGGLVVSVKIGGGNNLHNLDAYLVLLLLIGVYLYYDRFVEEEIGLSSEVSYHWVRTLALVAVPIFFSLQGGGPMRLPSEDVTRPALNYLSWAVNYAAREDGEVLFVAERHLLLFEDEFDMPLVPRYEKVFFMEMVMSQNRPYLEEFYADIRSQRFEAIVIDPLATFYKGEQRSWAEEHNVWVRFVSRPLLCYYRPRLTLDAMPVQVLYPRRDVQDCPIIAKNLERLAEK
jgi:hypothetical protein